MSDRSKTQTLVLGNRTIRYKVRKSARARYLRLQITASSGLTVIMPKSCSLREVETFLYEKRQWIIATLDRVDQETKTAPQLLQEGSLLLYRGKQHKLALQRTASPFYTVEVSAGTLLVTRPHEGQVDIGVVIATWMKQQAKDLLPDRVQTLASEKKLTVNRISIKNQHTRWGSCSQKHNINLNWRLLMAPPDVTDYVILHELAHLKEMNHSKQFWKLVKAWCPDYQQHRQWLRTNDSLLHLW